MRRVVIVGNGIAGMTAADTLQAEGFDGEVVLIGDEDHPPYSRPALSKALLRDEEDLTSHLLPPPTHRATEIRGVRAVGLDPQARLVILDDGQQVPYEGLIIATGCRPRHLGGDASVEQVTLRTLDDALALRRSIADKPSVVVIGGGPLGMEIASGAVDGGCQVTVVSQGPPLQLQLGDYLSGVFVAAAEAHGVRIIDTAEARVVNRDSATDVVLADGTTLTADLVITAAGDVPNVEWLESSGLLTGGVLLADEQGRVAPDIVAAGDVATVPTPVGVRRMPLWMSAIDQGKLAATALLAGAAGDSADSGESGTTTAAKPYFWTEQFGLSLKAVGYVPFRGEPEVVEEGDDGKLLVRWSGDEASSGAAAINYRIPIPKLRRLASAG